MGTDRKLEIMVKKQLLKIFTIFLSKFKELHIFPAANAWIIFFLKNGQWFQNEINTNYLLFSILRNTLCYEVFLL